MLADLLSSVDLTTKTDKMHISSFFRRQIDKLDEIDRNLPQVRSEHSLFIILYIISFNILLFLVEKVSFSDLHITGSKRTQ